MQSLDELKPEVAQILPFGAAARGYFIPVTKKDGGLVVWHTDQLDLYALDEFRHGQNLPVLPVEVDDSLFHSALQRAYEQEALVGDNFLDDLSLETLAEELAEKPDLLETQDDAPIIQLVNNIIVQALRSRSSDIHVEPFENDIVVRYRVDGVLHTVLKPPKPVQAPLLSRIKVMAGLNIAEKRLPQDGSMRVNVAQREVDVRVSALPTAHGERIVMRLLDKDENMAGLAELGLSEQQVYWMRQRLSATHGILLVTGPTGSGKSTSLYAALNSINDQQKNIITIEDPIEYSLAGVGQIQVNPKIGLSFASGLRSILRQDPDVIMVGEIRDLETAEIAVQASLTGHLVFSTLHTNDCVGAVSRLMDMGIEPFLISSALEGVVAQRLVRRLCNHCKDSYHPAPDLLADVQTASWYPQSATYYRPVGCDHCMGTGYRGRTAIFEMLTVSDGIRDLITNRSPDHDIRSLARREGMLSLRDSGLLKAAEGKTSLEEVFRVTQDSIQDL